jgi:hypothetical protein
MKRARAGLICCNNALLSLRRLMTRRARVAQSGRGRLFTPTSARNARGKQHARMSRLAERVTLIIICEGEASSDGTSTIGVAIGRQHQGLDLLISNYPRI